MCPFRGSRQEQQGNKRNRPIVIIPQYVLEDKGIGFTYDIQLAAIHPKLQDFTFPSLTYSLLSPSRLPVEDTALVSFNLQLIFFTKPLSHCRFIARCQCIYHSQIRGMKDLGQPCSDRSGNQTWVSGMRVGDREIARLTNHIDKSLLLDVLENICISFSIRELHFRAWEEAGEGDSK